MSMSRDRRLWDLEHRLLRLEGAILPALEGRAAAVEQSNLVLGVLWATNNLVWVPPASNLTLVDPSYTTRTLVNSGSTWATSGSVSNSFAAGCGCAAASGFNIVYRMNTGTGGNYTLNVTYPVKDPVTWGVTSACPWSGAFQATCTIVFSPSTNTGSSLTWNTVSSCVITPSSGPLITVTQGLYCPSVPTITVHS